MMDEERDLKDGDERVKAAEFRGEVLARLGAIETKLDRMNGLRECVESTRVPGARAAAAECRTSARCANRYARPAGDGPGPDQLRRRTRYG